jgi:transposase InsO family protein
VAQGRAGLRARSHATKASCQLQRRWLRRVLALRQRRASWGPHKLRWWLQACYPLGPWPSERTIGRWLDQAGVTRRRVRHSPRGSDLLVTRGSSARHANHVWTIDFKGPFRTGNGQRVVPLTVRDLATRCVLCVQRVARADETSVRAVLERVFRRCGLPRVIRVDNGTPFGGTGARGLSTLSVWWLQLGIEVEFIRPGCPQDNGAHEQMHRILKAATARPAAANPLAQQRRFDRWRRHYNWERPHEALGMQVPGQAYIRSERAMPTVIPAWSYPADWRQLDLDAKGRCHWADRQRHVGRAFVGQRLALTQEASDVTDVYLGPFLLGQLHRRDHAGLRAVRRLQPKGKEQEGATPPPATLPI